MSTVPDPRFEDIDARQLLEALAGVVSAHIVTDDLGRMREIHVLASPALHPKQVVRNVESALSAGLGIDVDRRIVSVAQIRETNGGAGGAADPDVAERLLARLAGHADEGDPDEPAADPARRAEFVRYRSRRDAERCACDVVLRAGGEEYTGTATRPDTAAGRAEAAARAVFDALMRARPGLELALEGAAITACRGRNFVIVSAHTLLHRTTVPLAGAAPLTRSPEEAGILAALQASNRWSG
ncbi:MAG: hypothetical protein ACOCVZ_05255 [Gemmatimonadota bacterium]